MIHDTPQRVFEISELTRLIAGQLVLISRKSAVSFACACRCLEEPILSTLWETQGSLCTLLEVLPRNSWFYEGTVSYPRVVRGLGLPLEGSNAEGFGYLVQDQGRSVARGLE